MARSYSAAIFFFIAAAVAGCGVGQRALEPTNGNAWSSIAAPTVSSSPRGHLYVLMFQGSEGIGPSPTPTPGWIDIYSVTDTGNHLPRRDIAGNNTLLQGGPQELAVDRYGDVYVTCIVCYSLGRLTSGGLLQFAPGSSGDAAPERVLLATYPYGVAADRLGDPWVYDSGALYRFPIGPGGGTYQQVSGSNTGLGGVDSVVARNHQGRIYVSGGTTGYFEVFAPTAQGNVAPVRTFDDGGNPETVYGMAFDSSDNLFVIATVNGAPEVDEYPANAKGLVTPTVVLSGPLTGMFQVDGIAIDDTNRIFISNCRATCLAGYPNVTVYAAGATGDVPPTAVLTLDQNTGGTGVAAIAIGK